MATLRTSAEIRTWAQHAFKFFKTTLVGGVVFLAPLVVLIWLAGKAGKILRRLAQPLDPHLPFDKVAGILVADVVAVALLILICFMGGLLARASMAGRFIRKAESGVLWRIPGYGFVKALTDSLDTNRAAATMRPVLIHFDDAAQLAFQVDQLPDGRRVIYIPSSPDPRAGNVMVMDADRVEDVPMSFMATLRTLRALGRGLGASMNGSARST